MTHIMHTRGVTEMRKTKMKARVGTRYTGAMTTVTKPTMSQGIFLKRRERAADYNTSPH